MDKDDVPYLYWLGYTWAGWITSHPDTMLAMADLSIVLMIMESVLLHDEAYNDGGVHTFFGIYFASRPPALGGDLDKSLMHFEKAIHMAPDYSLMPKVLMARFYARMTFDQTLFETLLRSVLDAPSLNDPNLNLMNAIAQQKAQVMLEEIDEYF